ncbi:Transposon Tf2-9 poly [Paramuricea clavata]|uniref:Transposon Tf2-9 poly n=1 Tax=Paramuricea clavata TaxID=317549 RepID=A0A6S7FEY5_PARCT|nr:Transposon Tf2-9 poly [Paramuricea clavata]
MAKILSGIPRTLNNRDVIMIGGVDLADDDKNLKIVLGRLKDYNLTLRQEKCEFRKSTLEFHGHLFTAEGLKLSASKVDATATALTTAPVLIPYQLGRETLVIVDGSPEGFGGALLQKTADRFQPVHYVSRTLTDTEKRYSQIETEGIAAEFSTNRLQMYLLGAPKFKLATDHKPLLPLLNNPKAKIPPRIERIIIKMQNLDFEAIHIPGKSNITDYLSRHPLPETSKDHIEKHVNAKATAEDKELCELTETIETGNWSEAKQFLKPYYEVRDELFVADGVIMRMDRIVPPQSLRQRIIQSAHKQGHLGVNKTKEMIRRKYWFPEMNTRITDTVQTCFNCQIATDHHHIEPAKMTELPDRPWDVVEADFCAPLPNHKYALVLTDQYSQYPEVEMVTSTSTIPVTKKLKKIFSTHGIPRILQTDNGPPFNGEQFQTFAEDMGFHHKRVTPIHPKAQGQVENFNKLINKTTKIACEEGIEIESAIYDMLQAYRQTPHPATKSTPYEVLMHRQVRT